MKVTTAHRFPAALERRIKRRLIGRKQSFFAVTAPGLETLCRAELEAHMESVAIKASEKGGVAFEGRLHEIYAANLHCRTAHRFLMRIDEFRAATFETLLQKTVKIPWELYLPPGGRTDIKVSTYHSKLYHSDAVAERIQSGIESRLAAHAPAVSLPKEGGQLQRVYARLTRDRCLLSIDSSGDNLHKRGLRPGGSRAPLRETLAAGILLRAGYTGRETLCDPMCGSGTFAIEAALIATKIPPGWFRPFAFQNWPAFREGRWRHVRRMAAPPETTWPQPLIHASDRRSAAVSRLQATLATYGLGEVARATCADFEHCDGSALDPAGGLVVLNPPYGRRLGSRKSAEETYLRIGRHLKTKFRGWQAAVLAPSRRLADLMGLKARRYVILHGGQRVHVLIGKIRA